MDQLRAMYGSARDYFLANMAWLVPVIAAGVLVALGLGLLFLWLNSRGKFMFLHCVALNRAEIEVPWEKYGAVANRLFWFRLVLSLAGGALGLPLLVLLVVLIVRLLELGEMNVPLIFAAMATGAILFALVLILALVQKFLVDFVVPILYLRGGSCVAAWREFSRLLAAHAGSFVLYILVQIVLGIALGMLVILVFLLTCCVACCVVQLPYIGTVLLLPILVFKRAYALYFLAQFGPSYDVFPARPPVTATPPPAGLQPL